MDILLILGGLNLALIVAGWSCAKSYFDKGRLQGMEEAIREISRGISSHYELEGQGVPERVAKAVKGIRAASEKRWKKGKGSCNGKSMARKACSPSSISLTRFHMATCGHPVTSP